MERFCLKWDSFENNVTRSYSQLRNENKFSDVTLVSDDHHLVSAHKVVLATCSKYFNDILKQDPTGSALLCLEGVGQNDLNNLLDYIYHGELTIPQEHIERFLQMAKRFKLNGIHVNSIQLDQSINQLDEEISSMNCELLKEADFSISQQVIKEEADEIKNNFLNPQSVCTSLGQKVDELIENEYLNTTLSSQNTQGGEVSSDMRQTHEIELQSYEDVREKIKDLYTKLNQFEYECKVCGKISTKSSNIKEHIETHIKGLRFPCRTCGKDFGSRSARSKHRCTGVLISFLK